MPQFEQVSVFSSLIFWSLVSFVLLLLLLKRYAFPPILEMLEEREKKIRGDIEHAEKLKAEAQKLKEEFDRQLSAAHEKANTIIHLATEESKKHQERMAQETQAKVRQMLKDAEQEIVSSRNKLLSEIRGYVAALTVSSTEKVLKKMIDRNENKRLVDESIEEVMRELGRK